MRTKGLHRYGRYSIGVPLICIGVAYFLAQMDIVALYDVWQYWPVLLILGGAVRIIDPDTPRDVTSGCWTMLIGVWLLANFEGWFGISFHNSWPLLLIGWGAILLLRAILQARMSGARTHEEKHHAQ